MAADALLHFHSCGVAHLWAAITHQMIQTEPCDEVAGLSEYSCAVLLCLCAQHWPIWSCWAHWACVAAFSGPTAASCKCRLCAWWTRIEWLWRGLFLHPYLSGIDFEGATEKEWRENKHMVQTLALRCMPCSPRTMRPPVWSWCNRQACHPQIRGNNAAFLRLPLNMSLWEQHNQPRVTTSCSVQTALE